jgi:hypothetical protein
MLLGAVVLLIIVVPFLAGVALHCLEREWVSLTVLCVAIAASAALTAAAIMLMPGWTAQLEHFDFAAVNRARIDPGKFPELSGLSIYLLPYEAALLGAIATGGLGWTLYRRIRYSL